MESAALPSLSTDHVAAFVELARRGSLRAAAESLFISEQGVRSRLLALERRLGVELYIKQRGLRRRTPLTAAGRRFLPQAAAFLERRTICAASSRPRPSGKRSTSSPANT
ncbi:MAG: LysR family transcriptional regulator [Pirellulales bacterium]